MLPSKTQISDLRKALTKGVRRTTMWFVMNKEGFRFWKNNDRILEFQPARARAKIVIAAMGSDGFNTRGKVKAKHFFPSFCRVLGQYGIESTYVKDITALEKEIQSSKGMPTILIDLVNETYDDPYAYEIPEVLSRKLSAVFNSRHLARIIRDKKEAKAFLSRNNILMPSIASLEHKKIFSNARIGSQAPVLVYENVTEMDEGRYNTEFIDTRIRFQNTVYYTTVRLMCIGSRLLSAYVRARDERENNPSVHAADTPQDRELLHYLYELLILSRIEEYSMLAKKLGSVLGPGFYAHDILVANESGELYVCETGFKFFDNSYWKRVSCIIGDSEFQYSVFEQKPYAGYAASVFVAYCTEMGFL